MIQVTFHITSDEARALIQERGSGIVAALAKQISLETLRLQAHIRANHLSGRPGLQRITGHLSGSIRVIPTEIKGDTIIGVVEGAGGPTAYGKVHEFGGTHTYMIVPTKARVLAFEAGGKTIFAKRVVHPPLPARPFMSSSLRELRETIIANLQEAVAKALEGEGNA